MSQAGGIGSCQCHLIAALPVLISHNEAFSCERRSTLARAERESCHLAGSALSERLVEMTRERHRSNCLEMAVGHGKSRSSSTGPISELGGLDVTFVHVRQALVDGLEPAAHVDPREDDLALREQRR